MTVNRDLRSVENATKQAPKAPNKGNSVENATPVEPEPKRATQRAIAGALGVDASTVNRDLKPVADATKQAEIAPNKDDFVASATPGEPYGAMVLP